MLVLAGCPTQAVRGTSFLLAIHAGVFQEGRITAVGLGSFHEGSSAAFDIGAA